MSAEESGTETKTQHLQGEKLVDAIAETKHGEHRLEGRGMAHLRDLIGPALLLAALAMLTVTSAVFFATSTEAQEAAEEEGDPQDAQPEAQEENAQVTSDDGTPLVNLNTATAAELETLPGIGPSKAAAIIAQRERRAFRRVRDIMRVRGIGRATYRNLRELVRVE